MAIKGLMQAAGVVALLAGIFVFTGARGRFSPGACQEDEPSTRRIWDSEYIDKNGNVHAKGHRRYKVITTKVPTIGVASDSVVGITIWRLQDSKPDDSGTRMLVHGLAPVRTEADTMFTVGQLVRLGIETSRHGFVYVIDQEQYKDGKLGDPYLIFPTLRTRMGDNEAVRGQVIEVPDRDDQPPYFTLTPSREGEVAEALTVIVSPNRIESIFTPRDPIKLDGMQLARWEKDWGVTSGRAELEGGAGRGWTEEEKEAGENSTRMLKQDDIGPQTLFYNPRSRPGMPVMVKLELRYAP